MKYSSTEWENEGSRGSGRKGLSEVGSQITEASFSLVVCFPPTTSDCPGAAAGAEGRGSWIYPAWGCKHAS